MLGEPDTSVLNHLAAKWDREDLTYADAIEAGEQIASLLEHPGWALIDGTIAEVRGSGIERLLGTKAVLDQAEYAQKTALLNGMTFAADVAASYLKRAERARDELNEEARREVAQEGS